MVGLLGAMACGEDGSTEETEMPTAGEPCLSPGAGGMCTCTDTGSTGTRLCQDNGTWGACSCSVNLGSCVEGIKYQCDPCSGETTGKIVVCTDGMTNCGCGNGMGGGGGSGGNDGSDAGADDDAG